MTRERRLGRGLEALLGRVPGGAAEPVPGEGLSQGSTGEPYADEPSREAPPPAQADSEQSVPPASQQPLPHHEVPPAAGQWPGGPSGAPRRLEIRQIERNPFQPRRDFDQAEMQSLAESLNAHGLLQPVVVRRVEGRYQLIAGERRLQAAEQAGWTEVPVSVIQADNRQTAELAIIENLQRKDLNPLEKAAAFQNYLRRYGGTQEELAARLKLDRSTIANLIRLLELPGPVQDAIRGGRITQGHARALLPLGEEREQIEFCVRIQREGLNVRQTETLVQQTVEADDADSLGVVDRDGKVLRRARVQSEHLAALEQELQAALGTKVKLIHTAGGRGKLVIHFRSHQEFERIRRHLTDGGHPAARTHAG